METKTPKKVSLAPIPGFPEFSIGESIVMNDVKRKIRQIYELYGYVPFDTRLVETDQVLNQKGIDTISISENLTSLGIDTIKISINLEKK